MAAGPKVNTSSIPTHDLKWYVSESMMKIFQETKAKDLAITKPKFEKTELEPIV